MTAETYLVDTVPTSPWHARLALCSLIENIAVLLRIGMEG